MKKYKELYYQSLEKNKLLETINTNLINLINKLEIKNEQIKYPIDSNQNKNLKFISLEEKKKYIINKFINNVKNKEILITNNKHDGSEGHWLEKQMGVTHNSKNEPDILGFEMKKESSKITFGDFSASEYLFSKNKILLNNFNKWNNDNSITRTEFIRYFGHPNKLKNNRYSWSGKCVPKYNIWNSYGQTLKFNNNLDLCVYYSFEHDNRESKTSFPDFLKNSLMIAIWQKCKIESHINKKFNNNGFFICKKINSSLYNKICFGRPFNYDYFVDNIKNNIIIFDSGMYETNSRNYSHFRSNKKFWDLLLDEEF